MEKLVFYPGNFTFKSKVYESAGLSQMTSGINSINLEQITSLGHLLLQNCEGCAGTLGTFGTAGGCFGTLGSYGSYGCGD